MESAPKLRQFEGIILDLSVIYSLNNRENRRHTFYSIMNLTIERAFSWDSTLEGHPFWNGIYHDYPNAVIFEKALPIEGFIKPKIERPHEIMKTFNLIASAALRKLYQQ